MSWCRLHTGVARTQHHMGPSLQVHKELYMVCRVDRLYDPWRNFMFTGIDGADSGGPLYTWHVVLGSTMLLV